MSDVPKFAKLLLVMPSTNAKDIIFWNETY